MLDEGTYSATCRISVGAPPELAFRMWSEPDLLGSWMGYRESGGEGKPRLVRIGRVEIAPLPGAAFRVDMITREADGSERTWVHEGEVVSASPHYEISLTWISEGTDHASTLLTLGFTPEGEGTAVELRHDGFSTRQMADAHAEGWDIFLELFNEAVISAASAGVKIVAGELRRRLEARKGAASEEAGQSAAGGSVEGGDPTHAEGATERAGSGDGGTEASEERRGSSPEESPPSPRVT